MLSTKQKQWRIKVFAVTWLAYAAFYFCRKNFSVIMPMISEDFNYSKDDLAILIGGYSLSYMFGQFSNGFLADKFGPRLVVTIGMIVSITANVMMGLSGTFGLLLFFMGLNGLGQSSGWPGLIKNMATWFRRDERGIVMSWWTTNYVIGSFVATIFATYWATSQTLFPDLGWKPGFWAPSVILLIATIIYGLFTRNRPPDAGLPVIVKEEDTGSASTGFDKKILREVLNHPTIWIASGIYFLLKMTRYAFLFWLPLYMTEALSYDNSTAGYMSSVYELTGFLGVIAAGYLSDKIFNSKRFPISTIMLAGLAVLCFLQPMLSQMGMVATAISIGLIGLTTYGPDSIISGAAAMDIGGKRGAATAAGVINGVGSTGQLLSPFVVAFVSNTFGWDGLFYLFVVLALSGAILSALRWNFGGTSKPEKSS